LSKTRKEASPSKPGKRFARSCGGAIHDDEAWLLTLEPIELSTRPQPRGNLKAIYSISQCCPLPVRNLNGSRLQDPDSFGALACLRSDAASISWSVSSLRRSWTPWASDGGNRRGCLVSVISYTFFGMKRGDSAIATETLVYSLICDHYLMPPSHSSFLNLSTRR